MIVCVSARYFAATIEQRADPRLVDVPLAIIDDNRVYGVSAEAAAEGIYTGITAAQARSLSPQVRLVPLVRSRHRAAYDQVMTSLARYTDRVALSGAATWHLDLGQLKMPAVFEITTQLVHQLAEEIGLQPAIGIAAGKFPAQVAALSTPPEQLLVIYDGQESNFLAPFPVNLLPVERDILERLARLGIRQLGQVAALPRHAILSQFGKGAVIWHRLARGQDDRPVPLYQPRQELTVSRQDDAAITNRLALEKWLGEMADELAQQLAATHQVGRELLLVAQLEAGESVEEQLILRRPSRQAPQLGQRLLEMLAQLPIRSGVTALTVTLSDLTQPLPQQRSLFTDHIAQQEILQNALTDLQTRYGDTCFYRANITDLDHRILERRFRLRGVD